MCFPYRLFRFCCFATSPLFFCSSLGTPSLFPPSPSLILSPRLSLFPSFSFSGGVFCGGLFLEDFPHPFCRLCHFGGLAYRILGSLLFAPFGPYVLYALCPLCWFRLAWASSVVHIHFRPFIFFFVRLKYPECGVRHHSLSSTCLCRFRLCGFGGSF